MRRSLSRWSNRGLAWLLFAALILIAGCTRPPGVTTSPAVSTGPLSQGTYADVVAKVVPSVVYVYAELPSTNPGEMILSAGSGVILRSDGYILTNKHVVDQARRVDVTLENRKTYQVTGTWTDDVVDLAVLKIDEQSLSAMPFGDPGNLRMGDWVIAMGHALGLSPLEGGLSVTAGVVSNLGRSFVVSGVQHYDVVQTDAAINPGNSGGPLVNMNGELIGINSAGVASVQNVGFAINVAIARHCFEDLVKFGKSHHPYLGIAAGDVTQDVAQRLKCQCNDGAFVTESESDGPAYGAGIRPDDMITRFDGNEIHTAAELVKYLWRHDVGDRVEVAFHHGSEEKIATVTLAERHGGPAI